MGKIMSISKTLLAGAALAYLLSGVSAHANELNVELNLGQPEYVAPAPVIVAPSPAYVTAPWVEGYDPHHRRHDWRYWHDHPRGHPDHWDHR